MPIPSVSGNTTGFLEEIVIAFFPALCSNDRRLTTSPLGIFAAKGRISMAGVIFAQFSKEAFL